MDRKAPAGFTVVLLIVARGSFFFGQNMKMLTTYYVLPFQEREKAVEGNQEKDIMSIIREKELC